MFVMIDLERFYYATFVTLNRLCDLAMLCSYVIFFLIHDIVGKLDVGASC